MQLMRRVVRRYWGSDEWLKTVKCVAQAWLILACACAAHGRPAELADPAYDDRHCDPSLVGLRVPTLSEVIDSTRGVEVITAHRPEGSIGTFVRITYTGMGEVQEVGSPNSLPSAADTELAAELRPLAQSLPHYPQVPRLVLYASHGSGTLLLIPDFEGTCVVDRGSLDSAQAVLATGNALRPPGDTPRTIELEFVINSRSEFVDVFVLRSTGIGALDLIAERALRTVRYKAPLYGKTPTAARVRQMFVFPKM